MIRKIITRPTAPIGAPPIPTPIVRNCLLKCLLVAILIKGGLGLLLVSVGALAQDYSPTNDQPISVTLQYHWHTSVLDITLRQPVTFDRVRQPAQAYYQTIHFNTILPTVIEQSLALLPYNDQQNVLQRIIADTNTTQLLEQIAQQAVLSSSQYDPSFQYVVAQYRLRIDQDIGKYLVLHTNTRPVITSYLTPQSGYTGIVVIADTLLPVRGTNSSSYLIPAIAPVMYDSQLRVVMSIHNVNPQVVRDQGVLMYSMRSNQAAIRARVGDNPLFIIAKELHGITPTNVIIDDQDAQRIFSHADNRALVNQGKVVIIVNTSSQKRDVTISQ